MSRDGNGFWSTSLSFNVGQILKCFFEAYLYTDPLPFHPASSRNSPSRPPSLFSLRQRPLLQCRPYSRPSHRPRSLFCECCDILLVAISVDSPASAEFAASCVLPSFLAFHSSARLIHTPQPIPPTFSTSLLPVVRPAGLSSKHACDRRLVVRAHTSTILLSLWLHPFLRYNIHDITREIHRLPVSYFRADYRSDP